MFTLLISLLAKVFSAPPTPPTPPIPPKMQTRWTHRDMKLCMRYEVRAGSDLMETREKMKRVFGPDFMEIDEFERLFRWFSDGNDEFDVDPIRKISEYFKNNPNALRHCLLYQFSSTEDAKVNYSYFVRAFGNDVINLEKFQFWFDRFSEEKSDENDNKEPISDLETLFQNDKKAVRCCILYQFLEGIRMRKAKVEVDDFVFNRYDSMRDRLGYDVIDYPEFTYWYYRFANGEFDLEDVRMNDDRKTVDFSDLPTNVMKKIVKKLDYYGRSATRKVCKTYRSIVNELPVKYKKIDLSPFDYPGYQIEFDDTYEMRYEPNGEDCVVAYSNRYISKKVNIVEESNFVDVAFNDLALALKNPDTEVERFLVGISEEYTDGGERLCSELMENLKFESKIRAKATTICINSIKTILSILNQLEPGKLEKMCIESCNGIPKSGILDDKLSVSEFNELVEMEQFKKAKQVKISNQLPDIPNLLEHFYHFNSFDINVFTITPEDIVQLVDVVSKSIDFKSCDIDIESPIENYKEICLKFTKKIVLVHEFIACRRKIPGSKDVLEFQIKEDCIQICREPGKSLSRYIF